MKKQTKRLRRWGLLLAAAGVCAALLGGCKHAAQPQAESTAALPELLVGSDSYPPFNYLDVDGAPTGIDVDLATEAFRRMGYEARFVTIDWEDKKTLVEDGSIDCIWGSFSMDGRADEYTWAGPYMASYQVVAVRTDSDIYTLQDLAGKTLAVQSTTKPEALFLGHADPRLPQLRAVYSLQDRDLIYPTLIKGYADALAAHDTAIQQFMTDYSVQYRILDEPLEVVGLGVAFAKTDKRGIAQQLTCTFEEMRADGTMRQILAKYLSDPERYLQPLEVNLP